MPQVYRKTIKQKKVAQPTASQGTKTQNIFNILTQVEEEGDG